MIDRVCPSNSCGHDGLSTKLVNLFIDCISLPLSNIFNKSISTGIVPQSMKIARVVPIFKSGDNTKLINYRPISILTVFSKLLERLVYNRMIKFINKYNILTSCQYGFRAGHSTSHAIIDLINTISKHIDSGGKVAGLFIDISKAFDSLNHSIVLKKLLAYGFRGIIHSWLSSYLDCRLQFVDVNSVKSSLAKLSLGVPQGSVIGPLLFILYINDLPLISNLCKFILFADDTTILFHEKCCTALTKLVNSTLVLLHEWFINNRLCLNLIKTCILPFGLQGFSTIDGVCINSNPVACVRSTKFLGVHIDFNCSWTTHTNYVFNKLSQCAAMLKACGHLLPIKTRIQIYFAFAYPYITYGVECWGVACMNRISPIIMKQTKLVRLIFGLSMRSHCAPFASLARILYVPDVTRLLLLKLSYKVFHSLSLPYTINGLFTRAKHAYHTRSVNYNFFELHSRLNVYHNSPVLCCIRLWNSLSISDKTAVSLKIFKTNIINNMFSTYV